MRSKLLISIGVVLATIAAGPSPASAARVVDANVTAGAQTSPDTSWLTRVAPCTRYVAPGGSDTTGTGAADKPWQTIKFGASRLQPENTLCVQAGSYREANIAPAVPGTSSSPIAIKVLGGPGAVTILPATTTPASEQSFFSLVTNAPVTEVGYLLIDNFTMNKQQHDGVGFYLVGSGNGATTWPSRTT
jgi:hypothetical protein